MSESGKITANLSPQVIDALKEVARKRGITMTEALRRAISSEKFLLEAQESGSKILIEDRDRNIRQVIFR